MHGQDISFFRNPGIDEKSMHTINVKGVTYLPEESVVVTGQKQDQ